MLELMFRERQSIYEARDAAIMQIITDNWRIPLYVGI